MDEEEKEGHTSGEEVKTIISLWCKRETTFSFSKASIKVWYKGSFNTSI
jgi:hypothetical protein